MKCIFFFVIASFSLFYAEIIHVPADQPTIQDGINEASNGDTVLVADGVYTGFHNKTLSWNGNEKHLIVKSQNGPESCIIDIEENGWGFRLLNMHQNSTDVIEGFTIKNSDKNAIFCENSSPTIRNNIIKNNISAGGCGINLYSSNAHVYENTIKENSAQPEVWPSFTYGAGIYIMYGSPEIYHNIIMDNEIYQGDGGGIFVAHSNAIIRNNLIINNYDSGISTHQDGYEPYFLIIENNTIINNEHHGILIHKNGSIKNNIIMYNEIGLYNNDFVGIIGNNNVWNNDENYVNFPPDIGNMNWGININGTACDSFFNISEDPLFSSSTEGNYFLSQLSSGQSIQSPCVDAGQGFPVDYGLEEFTTRTDLEWDENYVDIGFHYEGIEQVNFKENLIPNYSFQISNFPNPFNPSTTISFNVTQTSSFMTLGIYNLKGQKVKTLPVILSDAQHCIEGSGTANNYSVIWNGKDDNNKAIASGVYFARLKAGNQEVTRKMLLMK
ncbi:MAG: right-handed parallel beta-helix repeat-containing protein [Candidatus Cloacimonetes bacterium]|nr:right-handed parallel beta-helix repeat-containing protein [Candidatus Cloacimonadota bacterium]MCF7814173.1 right-handed parallel beta-helix repeat-containing protein [Candidatus Cloacimonadota bacterium]MCF7868764.1 right-handed parallel beta-helix repeat-containing protein [Candidatus Cloacimonadota bacterium]MCF7884167.1 right-handed parallel beta-helix repeat-containing protein [Candidatus Cloacimonadota bacterium]